MRCDSGKMWWLCFLRVVERCVCACLSVGDVTMAKVMAWRSNYAKNFGIVHFINRVDEVIIIYNLWVLAVFLLLVSEAVEMHANPGGWVYEQLTTHSVSCPFRKAA